MSSIACSSLSFEVTKCLAGIDVDLVALGQQLAGQRVDLDDALDLVAEEVDAHGQLLVGREDGRGVSPRRRNLPRTRLLSLRSYCMSTSGA